MSNANDQDQTREQLPQALSDLHRRVAELEAQLADMAQERQRYRTLLDLVPDGYLMTDLEGVVREANRTAATLFSLPEDLMVGRPLISFVNERLHEVFRAQLSQLGEGGLGKIQGWKLNMRTYDKQTFPAFVTVTAWRDSRGQLVSLHWLIRDATDQVQMDRALWIGEERFRSVAETASDAIIIFDRYENIVFWNRAAKDIFGYSAGETMGKLLVSILTEEFRQLTRREMEQVIATGRSDLIGKTVEMVGIRKGGHEFPIELSLATWRSGEDHFFTFIVRDVTQRKRTEEQLRQYTADLESRNEELDAFAHTVAHDLKGVLANMVGYADMIDAYYDTLDSEDLRGYLRVISQSGRQTSNIIDELLLLATVRQMEKVEMSPLDMAAIVAGAQERLAHLIEEYQPEIILPEGWPTAIGYGPWVEEVWVNYISNGIKYGGQPPRVELGATTPDKPGDRVHFWVRDDGPGLSAEEQARLFTPFTRLNQVRAKGHGLGLSIVRRIVDRLGGEVAVESEKGQGSVFSFILPAG